MDPQQELEKQARKEARQFLQQRYPDFFRDEVSDITKAGADATIEDIAAALISERTKAQDRERKVQDLIEAGDAMRHELFECRKSSEERSELRVRWDKSLRALRALRALTTPPSNEPK